MRYFHIKDDDIGYEYIRGEFMGSPMYWKENGIWVQKGVAGFNLRDPSVPPNNFERMSEISTEQIFELIFPDIL